MATVQWLMIGGGILMLAYGFWALKSGTIVGSWGRLEHRGGAVYWISVLFLISGGLMNIALGVRTFFR